MADEGDEIVEGFDPSLKKKKKKKKVEFGEDEAGAGGEGVEEVTEGIEDLSMEFGKKKKKKKKAAEDGGDAAAEDDDAAEAVEESFGKKKKKKKAFVAEDAEGEEGAGGSGDDDMDDDDDDDAGDENAGDGSGLPWAGTTRDYHYEELLGRVFGILRERNPELAGEKTKTILKPPQVLREGTKKTVFVNLMDICKAIHRQPDHVIQYMLAELGTSGSLDGQQRLILKGRFLPKVFEGVLRHYINDYVICNMCKSADTQLGREGRLYILRCQSCGASRSVAAIKTGFQAQIGRRKKAP